MDNIMTMKHKNANIAILDNTSIINFWLASIVQMINHFWIKIMYVLPVQLGKRSTALSIFASDYVSDVDLCYEHYLINKPIF